MIIQISDAKIAAEALAIFLKEELKNEKIERYRCMYLYLCIYIYGGKILN
jgi:hypothetical protein